MCFSDQISPTISEVDHTVFENINLKCKNLDHYQNENEEEEEELVPDEMYHKWIVKKVSPNF